MSSMFLLLRGRGEGEEQAVVSVAALTMDWASVSTHTRLLRFSSSACSRLDPSSVLPLSAEFLALCPSVYLNLRMLDPCRVLWSLYCDSPS